MLHVTLHFSFDVTHKKQVRLTWKCFLFSFSFLFLNTIIVWMHCNEEQNKWKAFFAWDLKCSVQLHCIWLNALDAFASIWI